ncbi:MAG: chromate resistance protein [Deltaproteobacteria bacterium]|nr:chromate resistance protein [Deltaproteobacteria bacterium]
MTSNDPLKWLLLIHQIPPNPNALRVKIWRRLQQVGAVAIKQSVYAMPISDQSREDLSWILKEIIAGGGDGSILEARFLEGLSDKQVISLFQGARKSDYEKIIQDANQLLAGWSPGDNNPRDSAVKGSAQVTKLRRRLDEVRNIDFYQATELGTAEILLNNLAAQVAGEASALSAVKEGFDTLKGKTWVTRKNLFVDRIACGWLIRRFVDKSAVFKFVGSVPYAPEPGEIRFDMFDGDYTHEGDRCTFEVMIGRMGLEDRALLPVSEVVHDIDLKDAKFGRSETDGFYALLAGLVASQADDDRRMREGLGLFENLYAFYKGRKGA